MGEFNFICFHSYTKISIPFRYDWEFEVWSSTKQLDKISIPFRYDWENVSPGFATIDIKFQFLLGTIGRLTLLAFISALRRFQFLLGTIGSCNRLLYSSIVHSFQFLLGTIGRGGGINIFMLNDIFQFLLGTIGRVI